MELCFAVEIVTPKKIVLNGLWFGPRRAREVVVVVHGLGSSLWKSLFFSLATNLARGGTGVLIFNNRGHDRISGLYRVGGNRPKRKWTGGASEVFTDCVDDIQGGLSLSGAMAKHPEAFSKFYVAMVKSGEESGKLEEIFIFLADYLERNFELARKARNALIYPAFVLGAFVVVMVLMLIFVIPKISSILTESGQALPFYTRVVIGMSDALRQFGVFIALGVGVAIAVLMQYARKAGGALYFARVQISVPILGGLYRKLYLARIADNLHTLLSGGITVVRALTITAEVVDNEVYKQILLDATEGVKGGSMISDAFSKYHDIPPLFSQMIRIGEETGKLDFILKSVSGFYRRDVDNLVDNLVTLIEPIMILLLGLGVGLLVASVLIPIYNMAGTF